MTSPPNPTFEGNEGLNPVLVELLTDPQVAQCLVGVFYDLHDIDYPGNGHKISGLKSGGTDNISPGVHHYIEYEGIIQRLHKDGVINMKDGKEFEGYVVSWGDAEKKVFTLTFNDRRGDRRPGSHTDYHIVMSPDTHAKAEPLIRDNPQAMISLFHKAYPSADRSEGSLSVKDYIELGDVAKPKTDTKKTNHVAASPGARTSSLLGRFGLRRQ